MYNFFLYKTSVFSNHARKYFNFILNSILNSLCKYVYKIFGVFCFYSGLVSNNERFRILPHFSDISFFLFCLLGFGLLTY